MTSGRPSGEVLAALDAVFNEAIALFHRLQAAAEQLHGEGEMTPGKRGVLRGLDRFGPQTVPQMARARPVSRQYIQTLVNVLAEEGHVEFIGNPAHQRSHLVCLTPRGKAFLEAMYRRERQALAGLEIPAGESELLRAAGVLKSLRELLESPEWRQRVMAAK